MTKGIYKRGVYKINKNSLENLTYRFPKGNIPWDKNKKGIHLSSKSEWRKNNTPWNKNKKLSIKHKKNLSKSHIGIQAGQKHPFWKGGITPIYTKIRNSQGGLLWRKAIFTRDNFTCQKYGVRGGNLVAHHIQNFAEFAELRFALDNGITLSKKAHDEFHKIYGRRNNTKEQLEEFLIKI